MPAVVGPQHWLVGAPLSLSDIVERMRTEVAERADGDADESRREAEAALVLGAALPDGTPAALRLRAHRLIRGGWRFHRCVNPDCGRLYPMGEEQCSCGHVTAPLYLCRNCGAHYLRFVGDPDEGPLRPSAVLGDEPEWMLFEPERFADAAADAEDDEEEGARSGRGRARAMPAQVRRRPVLDGSFDVGGLNFSPEEDDYGLRVTLVPARTRCFCCGGTAGSRKVITPVSLGTSAAVKVLGEGLAEALSEANRGREGHDGKERLLIFSDSRQDAAHQARFIIFASRYDRMRRRLAGLLAERGPLGIQTAVETLGALGVERLDNPYTPEHTDWIPDDAQRRIRAWEEAPLLDDFSVNAGYRGTLVNVGLVGVRYDQLDKYVQIRGADLAEALGVSTEDLEHVCRCMLDELRQRGAVSREMLRYHPQHSSCPSYVREANWERRVPRPQGYAATDQGEPLGSRDAAEIPVGVTRLNAWRGPKARGRPPSLERILRDLLRRFGGEEPHEEHMVELLSFLLRGNFLVAPELYGARDRIRLLQVDADVIRLELLTEGTRRRCRVCSHALPFSAEGSPCPRCHGVAVVWPDAEVDENWSVRRIRAAEVVPLVAREHTAQVPNQTRVEVEEDFKAPDARSRVNTMACSPTLEMGIDVGGLDAVLLRNVPPRPDNYAQRGGRAGRRSRVGLVVGYARNTPHDQYFYDSPAEMIAGEVPVPAVALGNRNVILRHLNAIAFSVSDPGIAGRMVEYVSRQGEVRQEQVDALLAGVHQASDRALSLARKVVGPRILAAAGLSERQLRDELEGLPARVQNVVERTARQVQELRQALDNLYRTLLGGRAGKRAAQLGARLLGIQTERRGMQAEADDRSAGYPLRRFAEFGILPGYEFPTQPAAFRLLGDEREDDAVMVARPYGISQFQPEAHVYARGRRWRAVGLDVALPWNPSTDGPSWTYRVCRGCGLRYRADHPRCPRCRNDTPGRDLPAGEFGGFLGIRDETPILDEEDRFATRNLVRIYPQWDGDVVGRWTVGQGWGLRLSRGEHVYWINEGAPPGAADLEAGAPRLHDDGKGYLLCAACGRMLRPSADQQRADRGRRQTRTHTRRQDQYGHADACPQRGAPPRPWAIAATGQSEILRLILPVPSAAEEDQVKPWGLSLGYSLLAGVLHAYMLDGSELDFNLEGPWEIGEGDTRCRVVAVTFVDPSLGGTGYLERVAAGFHVAAKHAQHHLEHGGCETACYRCLKSYANQRFHEYLQWPLALPYLEALAEAHPVTRSLETGDVEDPLPWLEAYRAGVGSPLELRFLRLFEQHGFHPRKQVPVAPSDAEAPISVADFAAPEARLAIYVDGASVHTGANLRRDRYIRNRLRAGDPPWKVEELRAVDLGRGRPLVEHLKSLAAEAS